MLEIPENQFDAFTVTFSSSHGYHALATLIDAAEAIGLDRKIARAAAAHALADGIAVWRAGTLPLDDLLQEAATPGGTAAAVMASINDAGYARIVSQSSVPESVKQGRTPDDDQAPSGDALMGPRYDPPRAGLHSS